MSKLREEDTIMFLPLFLKWSLFFLKVIFVQFFFLSHAHTYTHTDTQQTHSFTHNTEHAHVNTHTQTNRPLSHHTHTHKRTLTNTLTHAHVRIQIHSLSLSHTHTHTHTLKHPDTHTDIHTHLLTQKTHTYVRNMFPPCFLFSCFLLHSSEQQTLSLLRHTFFVFFVVVDFRTKFPRFFSLLTSSNDSD